MTDIVFLTVDSLRADHVGWHGYSRDTTPFLDSVSKRAHTFTEAFTNGCYTRQAFPSMMTSVYPSVAREDGGLAANNTTLAEALSERGYTTAGFHSNPYLGPEFGYDRGFDTFYDSKSEPTKMGKLRLWVKENIPKESWIYKTLEKLFAKSQEQAGIDPGTPSLPADEITDKAIQWVKTVPDRPRFLWVHYMDVHHPYTPPEKHQYTFRKEKISRQRAVKLQRKMLDQPDDITRDELSDLIDLYDAEIRFCDAEIKRLIDNIETHWGDDFVIGFTSDHGEEFRDHGGFSHSGTLHDELLHVPLLLADETVGERHDEIVSLLDIPPTFIDYTDEDIPIEFEGESLRSLITGGQRDRSYTIGDHGETISYRDKSWKYITGTERSELYCIDEDSKEQTNVVDQNPAIVEEIEQTLTQHRELGRRTESEINKEELEGEVQNRLEKLGYLDE